MRHIFILSSLLIATIGLNAQDQQIILNYGEVKDIKLEYKIAISDTVFLALIGPKLTKEKIDSFFRMTMITLKAGPRNGSFDADPLRKRMIEHDFKPDEIAESKKVDLFNLTQTFGKTMPGDTIVISPYLGLLAKNKPVLNPKKKIVIVLGPAAKTITRRDKDPAPSVIHAVMDDGDSNRLSKAIEVQKARIANLKAKKQNDIQEINNKMAASKLAKDAGDDVTKWSAKQRKKLAAEMDRFNSMYGLPAYFNDCENCADLTGDIIYDFRTKEYFVANRELAKEGGKFFYQTSYKLLTDLSKIKVKAQTRFKIKVIGINRYLYNIDGKVEDSMYANETPALFSQFFGASSDLFTGLTNAGAKSILESLSVDNKEALNDYFDDFLKKLKRFKDAYNVLLDEQTKAFVFCMDPDIQCCGVDTLGTLSAYKDLLSSATLALAKIEMIYLSEIPSSADILAKINTIQAKIDACKKNLAAARKEKEDAGKDPEKIKAAEEKIKKLSQDGCDDNAITSQEQEIAKLKNTLPLRVTMDAIKLSLPSNATLEQLYNFTKNLTKEQYFFTMSPAFPPGDKLKIVINMDPNDSIIAAKLGYFPASHQELNLEFSVRNKSTFSFSSGPFLAFGGDLTSSSFGFKRIPASGTTIGNDAKYRLDATGTEPIPIGLAAYANLGVKYTRNFGIAGTIGAGYSFNRVDILPAFLGGVTCSFGDRQRINLTFGVAGVQVKELQKDLYLGNVYDTEPTLTYTKPVRFSWFFSVSYSIFTATSKINIFSKSKK